jgi:iron complex outermembrane receptor protein
LKPVQRRLKTGFPKELDMSLHLPAVSRGYTRAACPPPRPHSGSRARPAWLPAALLCLIPVVAHAAATDDNIWNLSFAELANIEITSVSKKTERLADAAASVFVITRDDLRRSGVASLPEALRLAPNLHVAATSGTDYAISARGFNSSSANKLLVLIDGRSVYTPLFAGVFWDVQDVLLEDVERIEVISGPGGTLWGTNAVNGVINVITRSAKDTQGVLASASAGGLQSDGAARYGAVLDNGIAYRIFGKYTDHQHTQTASGAPVDDAGHMARVGFRADWQRDGDQFTVLGNAYRGAAEQPAPGTVYIAGTPMVLGAITVSGANLAGQWERQLDGGARVSWQAYFDRTQRDVIPTFAESLDIVDTQLQYTTAPIGTHILTWGANHRVSMDHLVNSRFIAFLPAEIKQKWSSLFLQDEISLRDDLRLTLGARIERNDYTGREFLPNVRLGWKVAPDQFLWSAVSRAVRAPSRFDRDVYVPAAPPFLLDGGAPVRSELATVYELGYRGQPASTLSYSVTAYHTVYDFLRTQEIAPDGRSLFFGSMMEGKASGVEMWATYQATSSWRLNAGFSALRERLTVKPGSTDTDSAASSGADPARKLTLRSSLDLSAQTQLDFTVRRLAALSLPAVPAYTALDVRLGWRPDPHWELSLGGQNVAGGHGEFTSVTTRAEFERTLYARAVAHF